jgi:putative colanic acid biosynthesis acetyltransferase WcaF
LPWRLKAGNDCWIGDEVYILNLDNVTLGNNVCLSQRAFLCTGSHDWSAPHFDLVHQPITIEDGVWICANAFIGPGVTVGRNTVVTVGSVVTKDLPPDMICGGQPCMPIKPRTIHDNP